MKKTKQRKRKEEQIRVKLMYVSYEKVLNGA